MDAPAPDAHITVRDAVAEDAPFLREVLADTFGSTMMAVHDELFDATGDAAAVAERDGRRVGLITYRHDGTETWEIISLAVTSQGSARAPPSSTGCGPQRSVRASPSCGW